MKQPVSIFEIGDLVKFSDGDNSFIFTGSNDSVGIVLGLKGMEKYDDLFKPYDSVVVNVIFGNKVTWLWESVLEKVDKNDNNN